MTRANLDFTLQREVDTETLDAIATECHSALKVNMNSVKAGDCCLVYSETGFSIN